MSDFFQVPSFQEIQEKTEQYVLATYRRQPVAFMFGQGEYLYDTEQKRYIDFLCGVAVTSLGHGDADIVEALRDQAERLIHTSNHFYIYEQAQLAETLVNYSFPSKVFFCNSGTEANEAAFKLMRRYGQKKKGGASLVLSLEKSFHGRTSASMALTGQEKIHKGFGPLMPDILHIPANDIEYLEKVFDEKGSDICGMLIELIQGEGGVRPMTQEFVHAARKLTEENQSLFVIDEIQTGFGRTGKLFAYENYSVLPDAITLAKGLGSGFPVGALIVGSDYTDILDAGSHGSTFGGNPLAMRVAYETIRIMMTRDILTHAISMADYFMERMIRMKGTFPVIKEVRGMGLLLGMELTIPGMPVVDSCREQGLLINCTADTTLRLLPPLNVSLEVAAAGLDILEDVLKKSS